MFLKIDGTILRMALFDKYLHRVAHLHVRIQDGSVVLGIGAEQQVPIWMYNTEILCTLSSMDCINILYKRMNIVF